jgi:FkbM family methyltransferase
LNVPVDYEPWVQWLYEQVLSPGDHCVDVGASEGRHLFPMLARVSPGGRVYAFEPVPSAYEKLGREIERRGAAPAVRLLPFAVSHQDGEAEFVVAMDALGYSGLQERRYDEHTPTRVRRIRVPVRRLDPLLADLPRLRFMKIDVEGGEWDAIRGAAEAISRHRPVVAFEFGENSYKSYGTDPGEVWDFFASRDYLLRDICGRRMRERQHFVDSSRLQQVWDYVAVPRELDGESIRYFGWRARFARFLPRALLAWHPPPGLRRLARRPGK